MRKFALFLILFVLGISNIAFASLHLNDITLSPINYRGTKEEALSAVFDLFGYTFEPGTNTSSINAYNNLLTNLSNSDWVLISHDFNATSSNYGAIFNIYLGYGEDFSGYTAYYIFAYLPGPRTILGFQNNGTNYNFSVSVNSDNNDYVLYYKNGEYLESGTESIYVNNFVFSPYYDIKYNFDNNLSNVLKRDYSVTSWNLGIVDDFGDYDYYEFTFNYAYSEEPLYSVKYDSNKNKVYGNVLAMSPGGQTSITSRYVDYNVSYKLNIYLYTNDLVTDTKTYYYRFLPINAIIGFTSGDSGDGYILSVGSGDYNTQNSTNDIMDSSEVDDIINEYLSGDIEDLADDFGFTALDNPFTTFLFHILESTYDALTLREPVVLTATYNGMTFTLNSNDFITPDSGFKTFIRALLIFLYIYGNYKYFHYLITLVETAKIDKVINEIGTDEFNDSNIM